MTDMRSVFMKAQLHERLMQLRTLVSEQVRQGPNSLGLAAMLGVLMDWWDHSPPDFDWLATAVERYPRRGRVRRTDPVNMEPQVAMRRVQPKGHDILVRRQAIGSGHRVVICRQCSMHYSTFDFTAPPAICPVTFGFSTIYEPKRWTKKELLQWNFAPEEVEWAADE